MLSIGSLKLNNGLIMAPLAGITNLPFRLMVRKMGPGLVTSEMVSAMGLRLGKEKSFRYLKSHPLEKPLAVQIFGSRPEVMAEGAQVASEAGADLLDINMGCPVRKVTKTGAGAALLKNPSLVEEIVTSVRLATPLPLTVKIRTGWSPAQSVALEIARVAEACGADGVTVHPRFATHGFSQPADWSIIRKVKEGVKIPVIGNGDVTQPVHALEMIQKTGCDGVMIGRGALGNPWIFKQILQLAEGRAFREPDLKERKAFIMEHYQRLTDEIGEHRAALNMRGLLLWYTKGLPHSSRFRETISKIRDFKSLVFHLDRYFSLVDQKEGWTLES